MGLSPASGSVLTARSLEPASDSVSPSLSAPSPLMLCLSLSLSKNIKKKNNCLAGGAWVAQSVKPPTLAQVMISQFVSMSPVSGSVLTAQSLEPALDSVSPSRVLYLPLSPPIPSSLSHSVKSKQTLI